MDGPKAFRAPHLGTLSKCSAEIDISNCYRLFYFVQLAIDWWKLHSLTMAVRRPNLDRTDFCSVLYKVLKHCFTT